MTIAATRTTRLPLEVSRKASARRSRRRAQSIACSPAPKRPTYTDRDANCGQARRPPRGPWLFCDRGQGPPEADPPAIPDLAPPGQPTTRVGARDQAGGRGLQLDERGRLRAPLLR